MWGFLRGKEKEQECWETLNSETTMQTIASQLWVEAAKEICTIASAKKLETDKYQASIKQIEQRCENSEWQCDEDTIVAHDGIVHFYELTRRYSIAARWQGRKMRELNYSFSLEDISNPVVKANLFKLIGLSFLAGTVNYFHL
jgi:hypothetical protein